MIWVKVHLYCWHLLSAILEQCLTIDIILQTAKLVLDEHFNQDPEHFCGAENFYSTWV